MRLTIIAFQNERASSIRIDLVLRPGKMNIKEIGNQSVGLLAFPADLPHTKIHAVNLQIQSAPRRRVRAGMHDAESLLHLTACPACWQEKVRAAFRTDQHREERAMGPWHRLCLLDSNSMACPRGAVGEGPTVRLLWTTLAFNYPQVALRS